MNIWKVLGLNRGHLTLFATALSTTPFLLELDQKYTEMFNLGWDEPLAPAASEVDDAGRVSARLLANFALAVQRQVSGDPVVPEFPHRIFRSR